MIRRRSTGHFRQCPNRVFPTLKNWKWSYRSIGDSPPLWLIDLPIYSVELHLHHSATSFFTWAIVIFALRWLSENRDTETVSSWPWYGKARDFMVEAVMERVYEWLSYFRGERDDGCAGIWHTAGHVAWEKSRKCWWFSSVNCFGFWRGFLKMKIWQSRRSADAILSVSDRQNSSTFMQLNSRNIYLFPCKYNIVTRSLMI